MRILQGQIMRIGKVVIFWVAFVLFITACSMFQAGKELIKTTYDVGKSEGQSIVIDEIERYQFQVLDYQKKLRKCRESKRCIKSKKNFLKKELVSLKKKIQRLKKRIEKARRKNVP